MFVNPPGGGPIFRGSIEERLEEQAGITNLTKPFSYRSVPNWPPTWNALTFPPAKHLRYVWRMTTNDRMGPLIHSPGLHRVGPRPVSSASPPRRSLVQPAHRHR